MKVPGLALLFTVFMVSCSERTHKPHGESFSGDSSLVKGKGENEESEAGLREMRKEYIASYKKTDKLDTIFKSPAGKTIHICGWYYCLFDSAVVVPKQYVLEDKSTTFTTHNFAHDILIVVDNDTIFDKTVTKADFEDKLPPVLKSYAVLLSPEFRYDRERSLFSFGYSLSIPLTDVGEGWRILVNEKGNVMKTDR